MLPLATQAELPLVADLVARGLVAGVVVVGALGDGFAVAMAAVQAGSATGPGWDFSRSGPRCFGL